MPASVRRLRLLSNFNFVLRDGGISLQRETGIPGLRSLSAGRGWNGNGNVAVATNTFINNNYNNATRTATRSSTPIPFLATSRGRHPRRSGFHSSPLSWFAAESSEDNTSASGDADAAATTTEAAAAAATDDASTDDDNNNGDDDDDQEPSATDIEYNLAPPVPLSEASRDKVQAIFDKVVWLDMIEVHLLTQIVNERMGIGWKETEMRQKGGGMVQAAGSGGGAPAEEAVEEKTIFDLKLLGFDAKAKIKVIKEVRTIAGLGLKEAKDMVEGAPKVIQKELKLEKAEELKAQLEAVGAQVELV